MSNIPAAIEKRSSARGYQPEKLIGVELGALVKTGDVSRETELCERVDWRRVHRRSVQEQDTLLLLDVQGQVLRRSFPDGREEDAGNG